MRRQCFRGRQTFISVLLVRIKAYSIICGVLVLLLICQWVSAIRSSNYSPLLSVTTETPNFSFSIQCNTLTGLSVWVHVHVCEYEHITQSWPWYECGRHCNRPHSALAANLNKSPSFPCTVLSESVHLEQICRMDALYWVVPQRL